MEAAPSPALSLQPPPASCWSTVVQKKPAPSPPLSNRVFPTSNSSKGISVLVVDASAIIHGDKFAGCADKFVSVREVLEEVRDHVSRQRLAFLPFSVEPMEPSPDSIKKVVKFARETGDLQTLSDVDLKLIALTYMLESQIHGTDHLRNRPPPLRVVNVKNLPEAQMPGWGDNVPNLSEWEAIEQGTEAELNHDSHILPLKDLDDNAIPKSEVAIQPVEQQDEHQSVFRHRRPNFPKREIKIEGKKMVADGVDASKGEDNDNVDDWRPAVSRSTHRRYLKRKAWRESRMKAEGNDNSVEEASMTDYNNKDDEAISLDDHDCVDFAKYEDSKDAQFEHEPPKNDKLEGSSFIANDISLVFEQMSLVSDKPEEEEDCAIPNIQIKPGHNLSEKNTLDDVCTAVEDDYDICEGQSGKLEVSSNVEGSINTSFFDDASSEQSWMLQSLSDSTVACITSDYAMQNVILQIGLRLLAQGGMQIRQLHRWVLKCHACNNVTQEIGKIFCPKCGNGGTFHKVSVTVGDNGIVLASRRQRIILRGTKFSLPLPQGGRDAITKNLILREDQLQHKLLYPKVKKKPNNQDDEFLCSDDIFSSTSEKRAPLKPPVRKALAMFSGKRNPNDNHFSRKH